MEELKKATKTPTIMEMVAKLEDVVLHSMRTKELSDALSMKLDRTQAKEGKQPGEGEAEQLTIVEMLNGIANELETNLCFIEGEINRAIRIIE